jgi:hypothetical protein
MINVPEEDSSSFRTTTCGTEQSIPRVVAAPGSYAYVGGGNGIEAVITYNNIGTNNEEVGVHYYAG